jgi:hypothetical protein
MRDGATFKGDVHLGGAKITGYVTMSGSTFEKNVNANRFSVGGDLFMRDGATFKGDVHLGGAKITGYVKMNGSTFEKSVDADDLSVGQSLFMQGGATFNGDVDLSNANVTGNVNMGDSIFEKSVNASSLSVRGHLITNGATFKDKVDVVAGQVTGQVDMSRATFEKRVDASSLSVGQSLLMQDSASFEDDLILRGAKVSAQLSMAGSSFEKGIDAESLSVGQSLVMRDATFKGRVVLGLAKIDGALDLRVATASDLDLSDVTIASELMLGGGSSAPEWFCRYNPDNEASHIRWALSDKDKAWRSARCGQDEQGKLPRLSLRNTQVGALQDSDDAWPPNLDLEGFKYDRLGGFAGQGKDDIRSRLPEQWLDSLGRDRQFSHQPYTQLATVLVASGNRDAGDTILYFGRERERRTVRDWRTWIWLTGLWGVAGYGIGQYTFQVLWWAAGLTVLGAAVLWFSPYARSQGLLWLLGASLHRLLPVVELSKEFKDFFDNPKRADCRTRRNLNGIQVAFFAVMALLGWIFGFFLIAAITGLTSKS